MVGASCCGWLVTIALNVALVGSAETFEAALE
jgi:hypothetical protein